MRNLKRALSLAVASVMLLGMMVVGTGASYTDVTSADNQEAIEVLQAVGIMTGDDQGNFNPDKGVTRAEMAVIMTKVLDLNTSNYSVSAMPFTDVPDWAKSYVAAIYAEGVTGGVSDTLYGTDDPITAAQAGLMLMKALGYFQYPSDLADGWVIATVRQAGRIGLFEGIETGAEEALSRNDVAQLVLNTLEADMVEPEGSQGVQIGDVVIGSTIKYEPRTSTKAGTNNQYAAINDDDAKGGVNDPYIVQLGEELFGGDLKKGESGTDSDTLGRPAYAWTYKNDEVGTYGDTADEVYVLDDTYEIDGTTTLMSVLQGEDFTDNEKLAFTTNTDTRVYVNGVGVSSKAGAVKNAFKNADKGGVVVELNYNDEDSNKVDRVVILHYSIAEIESVSTKLTTSEKENGATCKIKVGSTTCTDDEIVGFDADTYVEGAYLCYIVKDGEIVASQVAETLTGEVDATKGDDARINGTYYTDATGAVKVGDEGTFYLNVAGQIAATDTVSQSDNYAYIYNVKMSSGINSDGVEGTTFTAFYVTADGVKGSAVIAAELNEDGDAYVFENTDKQIASVTAGGSADNVKLTYTSGVIAYSINSDDELVREKEKDTISPTVETSKDITKNQAQGTDSSTQFIFTWVSGSTQKVETAVGYKNVNIDASADEDNYCGYYTVTNEDGDILYVFVAGKNGVLSGDITYAVLLDTKPEITKDGDDTIYTYEVAIDGEETTLSFKESDKIADAKLIKGYVFDYEMSGDYAKLVGTSNVVGADLKTKAGVSTKDYTTIGATQYNLSDIGAIYTITVEYKSSANVDVEDGGFDPASHTGDINSVSVSEGGDIEKDDYIAYILDGDDMDVLFVYDFIG